jgi:tryptophan-rich sensory protein
MKNIISLVFCVSICLAVGGLSGYATQSSITTWYLALNKPFFNPPNWIFGPVWTLLYIFMGIALWLIWNSEIKSPEDNKTRSKAIIVFVVQLFLNFLWSILFFGMKSPFFALIDIVLMLIAITITIIIFRKINTKTTWLLVPYFAWVSFATLLNASILVLN